MIHFVTYCLLCIFLSNSLCAALPTPSQEKPLVIVSCSGKSGSTTLESSFKHLNIETYRFHRITDSMYETISSTKRPVLLLDSMRDIISRKIASYFHHLANHLNLPIAEILNIYQTNPKLLFEKIQKRYFFIENHQFSLEFGPTASKIPSGTTYDFLSKSMHSAGIS